MNSCIDIKYGRFVITTGPHDTPVGRSDGYHSIVAAKQALTVMCKSRSRCDHCGALTGTIRSHTYDPFSNTYDITFCSDECEYDWSKERKEAREALAWATRMGYEPY